MVVRLFSWNVNGIRAAAAKGLLEWIAVEQPDVLCLQETKAGAATLPDTLLHPEGYESYWVHALRKGYSGVATYCRVPARSWGSGLAEDRFDAEGRVLMTDFGDFELYNVYFPNGQASPERLAYKLEFYDAFLRHVDSRAAMGRPVIFCGDVNTAHRPIDLAHPKANEKYSGFLPEERVWLDRWMEHGWVDSFRHIFPNTREAYSWWSFRADARARNIGWRLDYFFVHSSMLQRVMGAGIAPGVTGADHCPVWLDLAI
jgi:exodeoxyribonuclease III